MADQKAPKAWWPASRGVVVVAASKRDLITCQTVTFHDILIKMPFTVAHVQRSNYKIAVRDRFRASKVDAVLKVRLCRHI